jgi:hypothetical protein
MKYRKATFLLMLCILLVGCAGMAKMTPQERSRTLCADFMVQYEGWHKESLRILAADKVDKDIKLAVARNINPRLNQLHSIIVTYCEMAVEGQTVPSSDQIVALMTEITALFGEVRQ